MLGDHGHQVSQTSNVGESNVSTSLSFVGRIQRVENHRAAVKELCRAMGTRAAAGQSRKRDANERYPLSRPHLGWRSRVTRNAGRTTQAPSRPGRPGWPGAAPAVMALNMRRWLSGRRGADRCARRRGRHPPSRRRHRRLRRARGGHRLVVPACGRRHRRRHRLALLRRVPGRPACRAALARNRRRLAPRHPRGCRGPRLGRAPVGRPAADPAPRWPGQPEAQPAREPRCLVGRSGMLKA
jgi:hypothetical protein